MADSSREPREWDTPEGIDRMLERALGIDMDEIRNAAAEILAEHEQLGDEVNGDA